MKKIIIGIIVAVVAIGGTTGTVLGVNAYQEKKAQEEQQRIELEQAQATNTFNEKITSTVNALNIPDSEGQNPSLNNNNDIDAMNNTIASLQSIETEINSNATITEEQKNLLKSAIAGHIASITNRINIVNEERARAEAEAKAEAERQSKAEAKKQAQTKSNDSSAPTANSNNSESSKSNVDDNRRIALEEMQRLADAGDMAGYYERYAQYWDSIGDARATHCRFMAAQLRRGVPEEEVYKSFSVR